jgi:hypothetical protein
MVISAAGVVSWPSPVAGTYSVTVNVKDTKTGLTGQGVTTVQIVASGPVITAAAMSGVVGKPLAGAILLSSPGATGMSVSISGAPLGMMFSVSGTTLYAQWASPVVGSYALKVSLVDSLGRTAAATVPITVSAK